MERIINFIFEIFFKQKAIFWAVENNQISMLKFFIFIGMDISIKNADGRTPLAFAIQKDNKEIVEILLNPSIPINSSDQYFRDALYEAVINNNAAIIDILLNTKHESLILSFRIDIFLWAVHIGNKEIVDAMLDKGINVNSRAFHSLPALEQAIRSNHINIVETLLKRSKKNEMLGGQSALMIALEKDCKNIVEMFIKHSECFEVGNIFEKPFLRAVEKNNKDIVEMLIDKYPYLLTIKISGNTPLITALKNKSLEVFNTLIDRSQTLNSVDKSAFLDSCDDGHKTSLMIACGNSQKEFVSVLLRSGASLCKEDFSGFTALHYAAIKGNKDIVSYIVNKINESGISKEEFLNQANKNGQTALQLAAQMGHEEIFDTLVKKGAKVDLKDNDGNTVLHYASFNGNENIVNYIFEEINKGKISKEEFLNQANEKGQTALGFAVKKGNEKIVDKLVKEGANIDSVDNKGNTVLHYASGNGNPGVVHFILEKINRNQSGIDINQTNKEGQTALDFAVTLGKKEVISILIEEYKKLDNEGKKFFLNHVDSSGTTALHRAVIKGFKDIVNILLKAGEDLDEQSKEEFLNQANEKGQTALDLANRRPEIVNILIGAGAKQHSNQEHVKMQVQNSNQNKHMF